MNLIEAALWTFWVLFWLFVLGVDVWRVLTEREARREARQAKRTARE